MLFAVALLAFASLGLPDGVLGVAWPSVRATFRLPVEDLGVLLAATMIGYLGSSFSGGWLVARLGIGRLLVWSSALMVSHAALCALAPRWGLMMAAGVLAGLGAGAIDAGINAFAAMRFPPARLSWLHAAYGVGAMTGPLLMTTVLASHRSWRGGYAVLCLALGVALAPIYPLLVAETPGRLGEADTPNAIGFQVASAYLGAAALPWLGGVLAHRHGLPVIAPFLLGATMVLGVLHTFARRPPAAALKSPVAVPARG